MSNKIKKGILQHEDGMLFHRTVPCLLWYVNERHDRMCSSILSPYDVVKSKLDKNFQLLRQQLYLDIPTIIDDYLRDNPLDQSPEELSVVPNWKYFKSGYFVVYKYAQNGNAIMIGPIPDPHDKNKPKSEPDEIKVYEVAGLTDPVSTLLRERKLPVIAKAVVMPFQGEVIMDGVLIASLEPVHKDILEHVRELYNEAEAKNMIITKIEHKPENMGNYVQMQYALHKPTAKEKQNILTAYILMWSQPLNKDDPNYNQGYKKGITMNYTLQRTDECLCASGKLFGNCCFLKAPIDRPILCPTPPENEEELGKLPFAPMEHHIITFNIVDMDKVTKILDNTGFFVSLKCDSYIWIHDLKVKLEGAAGLVSYGNVQIIRKKRKLKAALLSRIRVVTLMRILLGAGCELLLASPKIRFLQSDFGGGSRPVLSDIPFDTSMIEMLVDKFPTSICNNYSCRKSASDLPSQKLLACSNCRSVHYCSKQCQKEDWPNHKENCKRKSVKKMAK